MTGNTDQYPRLKSPPIVEGLLDIQFAALEQSRLVDLEQLERDLPGYPKKAPRISIAGQMLMTPAGTSLNQDRSIIGFQFTNEPATKVFQARLDGITLNFLAPYSSFDDLESEARRLWLTFCNKIGRPSIRRIALRYINRLELPLPFSDFSVYIKTVPEVAQGMPQGLSHFSMRLTIPDTESEATAIVTEVMEGPRADGATVPLLFDIDVFQMVDLTTDDQTMWKIVTALREYKNRIFFSSITDELRRLYE